MVSRLFSEEFGISPQYWRLSARVGTIVHLFGTIVHLVWGGYPYSCAVFKPLSAYRQIRYRSPSALGPGWRHLV